MEKIFLCQMEKIFLLDIIHGDYRKTYILLLKRGFPHAPVGMWERLFLFCTQDCGIIEEGKNV